MRSLLVAALVLLIAPAVPGASAAAAGPDIGKIVIDPDLTTPDSSCADCVGVSLVVAQQPPQNCADCPSHSVWVSGQSGGGEDFHGDVEVCRGGFFYFCPVDKEVIIR